jgi:chromosomal replication initiation ATPase DnaA
MKKPNTIVQESYYYPLFEHMADNHGLTLLDGEMQEIERVVLGLKRNKLIDEINRLVCNVFLQGNNVQLFAKTKQAGVVKARQTAMYLLNKYCYISHDEIGEYFSLGRSVTAYSIREVADRIEVDLRYAGVVGMLEKQVEEFQSARNENH